MNRYSAFVQSIDDMMLSAQENGVLHLTLNDQILSGNKIAINNYELINFGSCSYLGLELDDRLKQSAIKAISRYGTQFSASRGYASLPIYKDLEDGFGDLFGYPSVLAPTSTLAHIGCIPILVDDDDIIILDHQVHNSVQTAVNLLKYRGIKVELIKHNDLNKLESILNHNKGRKGKVWYMVDGVYSMYGDFAPLDELMMLINKYSHFNLYIDDAHGMSSFGTNGRGFALNNISLNEQIVLTTSLAKGFGSGGGVMVCHSKKRAQFLRRSALTILMSGPLQPGTLGSNLASMKIHMSSEIVSLQQKLNENILFCNLCIKEAGLPLMAENSAPIFFIAVSLPGIGSKIIQNMMHKGYYLNYGIFPAVPIKKTGIRFTITCLHTKAQIKDMIHELSLSFSAVLEEFNYTKQNILDEFKFTNHINLPSQKTNTAQRIDDNFTIEVLNSINETTRQEWDYYFGDKGNYNFNGLLFLEQTFHNEQPLKENRWQFRYIIIRDSISQQPLLISFFTSVINKDDMLHKPEISNKIEKQRSNDPYFMCSQTLMMGSPLSEGDHLYYDKAFGNKEELFRIFFQKIKEIKHEVSADTVMLRDMDKEDIYLSNITKKYGYFGVSMPYNHSLNLGNINDLSKFIEGLSYKSRKHVRKFMVAKENLFKIQFDKKNITAEELFNLYTNVKGKSLAINTFDLPISLFNNMLHSKYWDLIQLRDKETNALTAWVFSFKTKSTYVPMMVGINYDYTQTHSNYRQCLYQIVKRALKLNLININLGFSADIEKSKLGTVRKEYIAYMDVNDHFNQEYMSSLSIIESA